MHRKFERNTARRRNPIANPLHQVDMRPVAGAEIRARLRDADDGLSALQFAARKSVVEVALQIKRRHIGIIRIIKPIL